MINALSNALNSTNDALCIPHRETFDLAGDEYSSTAMQAAQYLCGQCPLLTPCRKYALSTYETWGIWGGLTRNQRERIWASARRKQRQAGNEL